MDEITVDGLKKEDAMLRYQRKYNLSKIKAPLP